MTKKDEIEPALNNLYLYDFARFIVRDCQKRFGGDWDKYFEWLKKRNKELLDEFKAERK